MDNSTGTPIRTINDNAAIKAKLAEYDLPKISWTTFNSTEGYELNFIERLPAGFDSSKKYPVIFDIYGGPGRFCFVPADSLQD